MINPALQAITTAKAAGRKITALTAYDYPLARLLDECGVEVVLVGDSLGMVVLGYPDTTSVTMEQMTHHCAAVARGVRQGLVVCDLPYQSYESPDEAVRNARRLVAAGAHVVKLEGGASHAGQIAAITRVEIPVMAHIGMLPQSVKAEGGYRKKGRSTEEAARLLADARAVEQAGAIAVVLELVDAAAAQTISRELRIPTIGIGSGEECDGQVLVTHDLIGFFPWFKPRFAISHADVAGEIRRAVTAFIAQTAGGGRSPRLG